MNIKFKKIDKIKMDKFIDNQERVVLKLKDKLKVEEYKLKIFKEERNKN